MRDCAIVCGYPTNDNGTISDILKTRIDKAIELYQEHQINYIIVSGGAIHNQYSEAYTMRDYAIQHHVPKERILIENQAKSTYHNMMYSSEIMKKHCFQTCYIVTNSWHMCKARYYARKFDLDYLPIKSQKPSNMSYFIYIALHIWMPINMLINRLKGYK